MKFLGNILSTIIGLFVFFVICFFGFIIFAAVLGGDKDEVTVKSNSVLELNLDEVSRDYGGKFNFEDFNYFDSNHDGLVDILNAIEAAKTDEKIKGISLLNTNSSLGIAQTKTLRDKLEDFKKSGKFIMAYGDEMSQRQFYLNSVADKVYLNPIGGVDFKGLSYELLYFKELQEKSGIKMEVIRHGKYKSAVEPYLFNEMSPENKEQITSLLNSIWNTIVMDISKSRKIQVTELNSIANGLLARTAQGARKNKLIDIIAYEDVYHADIKKAIKVPASEDYNTVDIKDYANKIATTASNKGIKDKIAIIYAQGEINSGKGSIDVITEETMRTSLKEAREDEKIKAIVLRVDSPGGSALTSELIWREIEITKKVKPIIVSMGNYAASGGYYISCNANKIFAEPNTITGSIGVYGVLPNASILSNRYGVYSQLVKTHENASEYSPFRPLDENFKKHTQEGVENIYNTFLERVAKGRGMTTEKVNEIAQGRVWTGKEALAIGLVDKIGNLDAALLYASNLVKLKKYAIVSYPTFESGIEDFLKENGFPFMKSTEEIIKEELGEESYKAIKQIKSINAQKGIQARLVYDLNID